MRIKINISSDFEPNTSIPRVYGIYDYIVVGAALAGAVVASRLSESPKNRVLLLEAGGYQSRFSDIPGIDVFLSSLEFSWNYKTTPQTNACLVYYKYFEFTCPFLLFKQCPYPRGKGLGGSSIINTLVHTRGNKADYDGWCKQENPGWCYHGIGGNINAEYIKPDSPLLKAFIEGNSELGRKVFDYNGKAQLEVSKIQHDTIHGRRDSTGKAAPILPLRQDVEQYLNGYGRLTKASNLEGLGFFQTESEKTPGRPNIEIVIVPPSNSNGTEPPSFPFEQEYLEVLKTIDLTRTFKLGVALLRPKSRGVIKLRSPDPYEYPLINLNLLSDSNNEDIATLYDGIQIAVPKYY
ncbi:hypothetical protein ILUMI_19998 [Ignelater luminosus]|uniref:Glucose-methanol-choline oxidoreductase N-terminal domain-containing protein n=1 Tax=Ignelater luminosus TaxID=2038154 RepID=A0A8K0CLF1_IGNLU|nr:hypothetical protein ILUMI_19998 [Ignelater luminosus]